MAFFCFAFDERNKEMTLMGIGIIRQDKLQTVDVGGNEEENILTNKLVLRCKLWQNTSLFYDTDQSSHKYHRKQTQQIKFVLLRNRLTKGFKCEALCTIDLTCDAV